MAIANSSKTKLGLVREQVFGELPSTVPLVLMNQRDASSDLNLTVETILDESKTGSMDYRGQSQGNRTVTGTITAPLAYASYDSLLELCMYNTWEGDVLSTGTERQSALLEEAQPDSNFYAQYSGLVANGFTLDAPNTGSVQLSMDVMALREDTSTTSITSQPYVPYEDTTPFTHCKGLIREGGLPIAYAVGVNLQLTNNITALQFWGLCETGDLIAGRRAITGTLTVYFVSDALYNKYVQGTDTSLEFTLVSPQGSLVFNLPKINYTSGEKPSANSNDPRTLTLGFTAYEKDENTPAMTITRIPA